ncbi:MAG: flavohemoglobin expression-modulating QEGLA motif protein [Ignavibacteria bacterium]|nr:flavohemoglobin expression-modulating QEGLA motif protein [Ignavibacteria bacterium]
MKKISRNKLDPAANITEVISVLLKKNKVIRKTLPGEGRIHIDRSLPFICVYRNLPGKKDEGTKNLIYGTASYVTSGSFPKDKFKELITAIATILSGTFHSFLILEIWADDDRKQKKINLPGSIIPSFRVFSNERKGSGIISTLEVLENALSKISIHKQNGYSELLFTKDICPPGHDALMSLKNLKKINSHLAGISIRPVYRNIQTGKLYPQLLTNLSRQMAYALNRSFLEFTTKLTIHKVHHFYELGRRTFSKSASSSDRQLAELCDGYDFILQVSPINEAEARTDFKRRKYKKLTVFNYRPLAFDPSEFKRKLWNIPIEEIEDPALRNLFSEKREEIDLQISMMVNLDSPQFHYGSLQLYGNVSKSLSDFAEKILTLFTKKENSKGSKERISASEFYIYVKEEFSYYSVEYPSFIPEVEINKDMYSGLIVSKNKLLIGKEFAVRRNRVESLIHHEVGTHLLTYFNGLIQPFRQLHTGLSGYEELQEGLAVLSEYLTGGLNISRLRLLAARVKTAQYMIDGADFVESFHNLVNNYNFSAESSFTIVMRIYRGGGLTKDIIYLRGFLEILKYIESGGEIEQLFVGKISFSNISIMNELRLRKILKPIPLLPRYLKDAESQIRLKELRNGFTFTKYFKKLTQQSTK